MADNLESAQNNLSQPQTSQSGVGEGLSGQPSSPDVAALVGKIDNLEKQLRGLQGDKDRGVNRNTQAITDMQKTIEQYLGYAGGQVDSQAIRNMQLDQLLQGQPQQPPAPVTSSANGVAPQAQQSVDYVSLFNALGVSPNDNTVIKLTQQHKDPAALKAALVDYKMGQSSAPPPSPATVAMPTGGGVIQTTNRDQLAAQLEAAMQRGDRKERDRLTAEMDKLGWS